MNRHAVVVQQKGFWLFKRYRFYCNSCHERGQWYKNITVPNAQGWYHDDVTLFKMLTEGSDNKSQSA